MTLAASALGIISPVAGPHSDGTSCRSAISTSAPGARCAQWPDSYWTFPSLLWSFHGVASTFPESAGALAWCRSQGLDQDHCTATHLHN